MESLGAPGNPKSETRDCELNQLVSKLAVEIRNLDGISPVATGEVVRVHDGVTS
jgi:hypothetical protein